MKETDMISPDDPRLTAYALGELDAVECAEFERLLKQDAAACVAVEEIRATAGMLHLALEQEVMASSPMLEPKRRETLVAARAESARPPQARILSFPRFYYVAAGLAAACFAVVYVADNFSDRRQEALSHVVLHEANGAVASTPSPAASAVELPPAPADAGWLVLVPAAEPRPDRFFAAADTRTSTFPLRVGRESYIRIREQLQRGQRPARQTVHVAELINAFHYAWPEAAPGEAFSTVLEETAAPWATEHRLVRVGLRGVGSGGSEVAREAHVRVDFNPTQVRAWRLVGFERDGDALGIATNDPGETLRAGETVTALYEILPEPTAHEATDRTMMTVALEYRDPATGELRTLSRSLESRGGSFAQASPDMKFIVGVAAFGLRLRGSDLQASMDVEEMARWAEAGVANDAQRREFVGLMRGAARR